MADSESLAAPAGIDALLLAAAVTGVSFSAPLMVATAAPALAIAFWRNAMGAGVTSLFAAVRDRRSIARHDARTVRSWLLAALAGAALAAHFGTWVPSVTMTSVASSVALVSMQTVFAALIAEVRGRGLPRLAWIGIGAATVGTALVTGSDVALSMQSVFGDLLALVGGLAAACYVTIGSAARKRLSTASYTAVCYTICAVLLLGVCLIGGVRLVGFAADAWVKIALVTVCAQLVGHTLINLVLRSTSPTIVSMVILLEVPGAALVALIWLGQRPPVSALPGLLLLLVGLLLVARSCGRAVPVEATE